MGGTLRCVAARSMNTITPQLYTYNYVYGAFVHECMV